MPKLSRRPDFAVPPPRLTTFDIFNNLTSFCQPLDPIVWITKRRHLCSVIHITEVTRRDHRKDALAVLSKGNRRVPISTTPTTLTTTSTDESPRHAGENTEIVLGTEHQRLW